MKIVGSNLRARAKALNLSDAEVARRAGLGVRRYGNYVTGDREPDFQTLIRICTVLAITPNEILGLGGDVMPSVETEYDRLQARLMAASNLLDLEDMRVAVKLVEVLADRDK